MEVILAEFRHTLKLFYIFSRPWDISHLVGLELRFNLPQEIVQMVEYVAGNGPGHFFPYIEAMIGGLSSIIPYNELVIEGLSSIDPLNKFELVS